MYRRDRQRPAGSNFLQSGRPRVSRKKKVFSIGSVVVLAGIVLTVAFMGHINRTQTPGTANSARTEPAPQNTAGTTTNEPAGFNKAQYSTTDPASIWVVVNKQHPLTPKAYAPNDLVVPNIPLRSSITSDEKQLRAEPARELEQLVRAAAAEGLQLNLQSGYRSYNFQVNLYNSYVRQQGQAAADRTSARPGYSEHQTGFAVDLGSIQQPGCNVEKCYGDTKEGKWLAANAHTYGFIIRYTEDKESTTGYDYEPWHLRYVGSTLAREMHSKSIETLEEFFEISGGTKY